MRKAVSNIVVVVMLMMLTMSLVVMAYAFMDGFLGSAEAENQQNSNASINKINSCLQVVSLDEETNRMTIRNCGKSAVNNFTFLIDNTLAYTKIASVGPGEEKRVKINSSIGAHVIKILGGYGTAMTAFGISNLWLEPCGYRVPVTINNPGAALSDYQINMTFDTATLIANNKIGIGCKGINFTDSNGITPLNYWLEPATCNSPSSKFWAKVPSIPSGKKTIYLYYGCQSQNKAGSIWYNTKHLGLDGGVFNYSASDPNPPAIGEYSKKMQHELGMSSGFWGICAVNLGGNVICHGDNIAGALHNYTGGDAIDVSLGFSSTCILKKNGNVDCGGSLLSPDYNGGDAIGVSSSFNGRCVLKSNGNVNCGLIPAVTYNGGDAIGVSSRYNNACILKSNGNVECSGSIFGLPFNKYTGGDAIGVSAGYTASGSSLCVLKNNGNVSCFGDLLGTVLGDNYASAILKNYNGGDAIGVSTGFINTCFLKSNGNVTCQGRSVSGLANNYTGGDAIGVSTGVVSTYGTAGGLYYNCFLKPNRIVNCHGLNNITGAEGDINFENVINPFRKYASSEPALSAGGEEDISSWMAD